MVGDRVETGGQHLLRVQAELLAAGRYTLRVWREPSLSNFPVRGRGDQAVGSFWGAVVAALLVGLAIGLTAAYASEWSLLSIYVLLVVVVSVRTRGLFGKKSLLEA